jgi:D-alanyl-D-alanine carboxypeptidase
MKTKNPRIVPIRGALQTKALLTRNQALLNKYVAQGVPDVVLLVQSPKEGLWMGAAGKANLETGEPMSPCTLNYPQSIAKTFTATAMMMLAEEGKVNLDAKIKDYLPQATIAGIANATVRQMLNMTSDIVSYEQDEDWIASRLANLFGTFTPEVMLSYIRGDAADFEPGTSWRYSTTNYLLAALIIDQVKLAVATPICLPTASSSPYS